MNTLMLQTLHLSVIFTDEEDIDPNLQELFAEPIVGSVELIDAYAERWAAVIDDGYQSFTSDSMETAMEGWESNIDERNHSVDELEDGSLSGHLPKGVVERGKVSGEKYSKGIHEARGNYLRDAILYEGSTWRFNWIKFKFHQCMFDTWHNGTKSGLINTLKFWDYTQGFMMGLHRASQNTHNTHAKHTKLSRCVDFCCAHPFFTFPYSLSVFAIAFAILYVYFYFCN